MALKQQRRVSLSLSLIGEMASPPAPLYSAPFGCRERLRGWGLLMLSLRRGKGLGEPCCVVYRQPGRVWRWNKTGSSRERASTGCLAGSPWILILFPGWFYHGPVVASSARSFPSASALQLAGENIHISITVRPMGGRERQRLCTTLWSTFRLCPEEMHRDDGLLPARSFHELFESEFISSFPGP